MLRVLKKLWRRFLFWWHPPAQPPLYGLTLEDRIEFLEGFLPDFIALVAARKKKGVEISPSTAINLREMVRKERARFLYEEAWRSFEEEL